jgi:hypothetical protein
LRLLELDEDVRGGYDPLRTYNAIVKRWKGLDVSGDHFDV